jgi:hypothetical protein
MFFITNQSEKKNHFPVLSQKTQHIAPPDQHNKKKL